MSFEPEAIRAFEHAGWQRAASTYGNSFAHATAPYIQLLLEAAEISSGQHVLDVACGPGHLAAAACARGAIVNGLDFSAEMVAIARSAHPEVVVTEGDAEDLSLRRRRDRSDRRRRARHRDHRALPPARGDRRRDDA